MTTIITKNGSGAPTAGQLTTGELAVDLTNKELYTKDSGGNVIKVGAQGGSTGTFTDLTATSSFTSPGIDDNADATAITIDANENVGIGTTDPSSGTSAYYDNLVIKDTGVGAGLTIQANPTNGFGGVDFRNTSGAQVGKMFADMSSGTLGLETAGVSRINITSSGDVGIGTSAPLNKLVVSEGTGQHGIEFAPGTTSYMQAYDRATSDYGDLKIDAQTIAFGTDNGTERMRIDALGNVGIGTSNPVSAGSTFGSVTASGSAGGEYYVATGGTAKGNFFNYTADVNQVGLAAVDPAGELVFSTGGYSERMRIDSSGNVGINETSPFARLCLPFEDKIAVGSATYNYSLYREAGGYLKTVFADNYDSVNAAVTFRMRAGSANENDALTILGSGNVGIGTSSPNQPLEVSGTNGSAVIRLSNPDSTVSTDESLGSIEWYSNDASAPGGTGRQAVIDVVDSNSFGNAYAMAFTTSTDGVSGERMRISETGHLGIGESNPVEALTVINGTMAASNTTTPLTTPSHLLLTGIGNGNGFVNIDMGAQVNSTPYARISTEIDTAAGSTLLFHTSNNFGAMPTEHMRIDSSGNVGIGTASPNGKFDVKTSNAGFELWPEYATDTNLIINFDRTSSSYQNLQVRAASHQFLIGDSEKMRLDASGNLLVGTTAAISTTQTSVKAATTKNCLGLQNTNNNNYLITALSTTAEVFRVAGTGNVLNTNNSYGALSDERLKSDIVDASSQLDDIMAVKVRNYTLDSTGDTHIGVVAQELEASGMGSLVDEDKEGMKSVKYSVLYLKAVKALQEAVTRIETLEAEVAALKGA